MKSMFTETHEKETRGSERAGGACDETNERREGKGVVNRKSRERNICMERCDRSMCGGEERTTYINADKAASSQPASSYTSSPAKDSRYAS